jgi:hypothetical protein
MPAFPGGRRERARHRAESLDRVQEEIRRTQAEALGRTGARLADLLAQMADLDRILDRPVRAAGAPLPDPVAATAARNRLRDEARRVRDSLIIQREAVGLVSHGPVGERYPVPPPRPAPVSDPAEGRARHECPRP